MIKISLKILLVFSVIIYSSCCSLCKLETVVEYETDTVYYADSIVIPLIPEDYYAKTDRIDILFDSINTLKNLIRFIAELKPNEVIHIKEVPIYLKSDTVVLETEYAKSVSWINASVLNATLKNKDSAMMYVDSLISVVYNSEMTINTYKKNDSQLRDKLKVYRRLTWIFGIVLSLILLRMIFITSKK